MFSQRSKYTRHTSILEKLCWRVCETHSQNLDRNAGIYCKQPVAKEVTADWSDLSPPDY